MHQSTTPSLSQTIWPRWASRHFLTLSIVHVIYWPSTELSIKRWTCVNKRKNSGSRCTLNNNITRCTNGSRQLETKCQSESQRQTKGFGPSVTHSCNRSFIEGRILCLIMFPLVFVLWLWLWVYNSSALAPCDFWLFSKLRGCRYETIEEMKVAVTKVIDTLRQEDFHEAFQKLL